MEESVNDERKLEEAIKLEIAEKLDNTNEDFDKALVLILKELRLSKKYNERSAKNLAFVSWVYIIGFVLIILTLKSMR